MSDGYEYSVGYKKPPRHTQFKMGESGNRLGRRKGSISLKNRLRKALLETVEVNERGRRKKMTRLDVALRQLINKATGGDSKAFLLLTQLLEGGDLEPITLVISQADADL